ncbi:hypothetical protein FOC4_g10010706 [Fusarium odoratissimum]|uniref:Aminoglycoside phosphotransferase domain-containing protein n=1 Tax=Fusarium oxysporum f. sp. cubense (strain race 4) TaxID=2502994 RepID=N1RPS2_FUSC4|nr:hypothetical protein FOC4_g10010706 [Fusarium odoratissimum]
MSHLSQVPFNKIGSLFEEDNGGFSVGQMLEEMLPLLSNDSTGFTLSHPDLHTGNIFVDEDLNITSIVDWGSAIAGPVTELLATPGLATEMMWYFSHVVRLLSVENLSDSRDYGWLFHQRAMTPSNKQLLSKLREDDLTDDEVKE